MQANINLNDCVYVELTDYGWECVREHYRHVLGADADVEPYVRILKKRTEKRFTSKGRRKLTSFQLHDFMLCFGQYAYCGGKNFIRDNEVYLSFEEF